MNDAEYFSDIEDCELLENDKNKNRTIIPKDENLIRHAKKKDI